MDAPPPLYILSRAAILIALLVIGLLGFRFFKKFQRQAAISAELQSITSDSAFFQQFYAEDARKSLVRAVGLLAESKALGAAPDAVIDRGLGLKPEFFFSDAKRDEPPVRERIIRTCLRNNYENFLKLGYKADFYTLDAMKKGQLPAIPAGPHSGSRPVIAYLIDPALSPGLDKVIANLEIRPPPAGATPPGDIQIATAKQLARDLADARIIEETVCERIVAGLSPPTDAPEKR